MMGFPNLQNEKYIAIDIETNDPSIGQNLGCGFLRDGYILGVGIATIDKQFYFPLNHEHFDNDELFQEEKGFSSNVDKDNFFPWLRSLKHVPQIGQNITYDMCYLSLFDCVPDRMHDTIIAEPLIDENKKSYSLEALATEYLNEHKGDDELKSWCKIRKLTGRPQEHLKEMPASLVGKYCMTDCRQTLEIWKKQMPKIESEKLVKVYDLECELLHVLLYMKKLGVRVDESRMDELRISFSKKRDALQKEVDDMCGFNVNTHSASSLKKAFNKFGLEYGETEKGNACFDEKNLKSHGSVLGEQVMAIRHSEKMLSTYIDGIQKYVINGRVHAEFNPLRNMEDKGTGIGRFSSSKPNLQNVPRNNEEEISEIGNAIRSIFIPEEGKLWAKLDYSQEEMAIFFHFAKGEGADRLRKSYVDNPKIDIYKIIAGIYYGVKPEDVTKDQRSKFKTQTLGTLYGMSAEKLGRNMGLITLDTPIGKDVTKTYWDTVFKAQGTWEAKMKAGYEAVDIEDYAYLDQYVTAWQKMNAIHKKLPCLKETTKAAQEYANKYGYIRTITGRKRRFDNPNFTYKAFQAKDSGTGSDIMKIAMVEFYKRGLNNILDLHMTVHDELDVSFPDIKDGNDAVKELKELKKIMETCVELSIPLRVEAEKGNNWGEIKKWNI